MWRGKLWTRDEGAKPRTRSRRRAEPRRFGKVWRCDAAALVRQGRVRQRDDLLSLRRGHGCAAAREAAEDVVVVTVLVLIAGMVFWFTR